MGGYNYNSTTNECNPPIGTSLPAYNWSTMSTDNQSNGRGTKSNQSELNKFINANNISPNLSNCTTLTQNEVDNAIKNAKSRNGSFTQSECDVLWPGSNVNTNPYTGQEHCFTSGNFNTWPYIIWDMKDNNTGECVNRFAR
jgi:hypothetical protein